MSNQSRQPKGVPTGGQFAASAHAEAENVDLDERHGVSDMYPNGRCTACGQGVDEQGRCYQSECSNFDESSPYAGYDEDEDSEHLFDFQVPGSSSTFEVHLSQEGDDDEAEYEVYRDGAYIGSFEYTGDSEDHLEIEHTAQRYVRSVTPVPASAATEPACFGCDHQHDPNSSGQCFEADCVEGCSGCRTANITQNRDQTIARISNVEARTACQEYASAYGLAPTSLDDEVKWTALSHRTKSARDLGLGDRLPNGRVITRLGGQPGEVVVYADGVPIAEQTFNHGDPVRVHIDRADLTDPDWFEYEAHRIATGRIVDAEIAHGPLSDEERAQTRKVTRRALARATQPSNISPNFHDGPNADPRIADGRAKVGDNVTFSQPMHGETSYEVLGKRAQQVILGHDGTGVVWGENGEVEYVLRDVTTGRQTIETLRGAGWRRIPAPGDDGLGAQALADRGVRA